MKMIRPMPVNDAALTSSNVPETDYAAYNPATTYTLGARVIYIAANKHWIIESLQNANTGHPPTGLAADTWWLKVGATNRWRMFDAVVSGQTSNADSIDVTINCTGRVNGIALMNIAGATVRIIVTDTIDGVVYDKTTSLVSTMGITDWYVYFYEPIVRVSDFVALDLPAYYAPTVRVILSAPGGTALLGELVLGMQFSLGLTDNGASLGIDDYSVKQQDVWGNFSILERAYSKRATFAVEVENVRIDALHLLLASYRATPVVWVGIEGYSSTFIYGFYKGFRIDIPGPVVSACSLDLAGLT